MINISLLSSEWIHRLQHFKQLIVGFSGGLDSTVLLHLLASQPSLCSRILAVHVNHGISTNALNWQKHCEHFCGNLNISFITQTVEFDRSANIEDGARKARFSVFSNLVTQDDCLLLGHHLDDQAETVLLHLFRGTGVDGLAGMKEYTPLPKGSMARPLLAFARTQLLNYAEAQNLQWIEDESNVDTKYSRNYLRHQIIPMLTKKWPGVVGNLARSAIHCQQAQEHLHELAIQDCNELKMRRNSLFIEPLKSLDEGRIINVLRAWLKSNEVQLPSTVVLMLLIHEVLRASPDATPLVSWGGVCVRRYQGHIYLEPVTQVQVPKEQKWLNFPEPLVLEEGYILSVTASTTGLSIPNNAQLTVKFRQGGEKIVLHGQTKQLKKLFQEWQISTWNRDRIPLLYIDDHLAAVIGYAVSDLFYSTTAPAWVINLINTQVSLLPDHP